MAGLENDAKPVGVIGLGLMGSAICDRLLKDGYRPVVYNRTREKAEPLLARGARWSASPFKECERVIISLYSSEVVESVLEEMQRDLRPGTIILDTTTGDPQRTDCLGTRLAERGVTYLEAPISGSSEQVRLYMSTALVAGPESAVKSCQDLLNCIALKTYYVGEWGNGVRMKLVTNLVLGLNRAALAEGLVFAKAIGLPAETTLTVLLNSPAFSRTMEAKGPKMINGEFSPQARLTQHIKDVRLILDEASRSNKNLPLSSLHLLLLETAESNGLGELDNSTIIHAIDEYEASAPLSRDN